MKAGGGNPRRIWLNTYLPSNCGNGDIYSIISDFGIGFDLFMKFENDGYEWNKDSMLHELFRHVSEGDVKELADKDGKLALEVHSADIYGFLPNSMKSRIDTNMLSLKIIMFFDFTKPRYMSDSFVVCFITENRQYIEYCSAIVTRNSALGYNNFEGFLYEFGLPYNIIRRPMNEHTVFTAAFANFQNVYDVAKDKKLEDFESLLDEWSRDNLAMKFVSSIADFGSLDYLNMLYDKGLTFKQTFGDEAFRYLCDTLYSKLMTYSRVRDLSIDWPTDEVLAMVKNGGMNNQNAIKFLVICKAYYLMLEHESVNNGIFSDMSYLLSAMNGVNETSPEFLKVFAKKFIDIAESKTQSNVPVQ